MSVFDDKEHKKANASDALQGALNSGVLFLASDMAKTIENRIFENHIDALFRKVKREVFQAMDKHPAETNVTLIALGEEYGELVKAALDEPKNNVHEEAIQTIAMVLRLVLEGDRTIVDIRQNKGLDALGVNND